MATNSYELSNYQLADIGTRTLALFVDGAILSIIGSISFVSAWQTGIGASFIIGLIYSWFFWTRNHGQTPGKMLMKIRVIKTDGNPITDSDALIRYFGYLINDVLFIGWLWAFFDENKQGLHDKMAQTYVVKVQ